MYTLMFVFVMVVLATTNTLGQTIDGKWEIVYKLDIKTQNGFGTTCYFHGIKSPNKKDIIAVANINVDSPHIITSNDSGRTWTLTHHDKLTGTYNGDLYRPFKSNELSVPDTNLAIVVCDSGSYWRSTDNGETWKNYFIDNRKRIWRVDFWDNKRGILFQSIDSTDEILKTIDGGLTWFPISKPKPVNSSIATSYLFTKGEGICYSIEVDNKIDSVYYFHKSTDYGETWHEPFKGPKIPPFGNFYFYNENLGFNFGGVQISSWGGNKKFIRRTSDGGKTWNMVMDTAFIPNDGITDIHFLDSLNGIAASISNIFRTIDGGLTWFHDTTYNYKTDPRISLVYLIDNNNAIGLSTNMDHNVIRFTSEPSTNIIDNYQVEKFEVFLNPAIFSLNLNISEGFDEFSEYSIYTIDGQVIKSGSVSKKIEIAELNTGLYYLIISKDKKIFYSKFIKI